MHKLLKLWETSIGHEQHARLAVNLARRRLLLDSLKTAGTLGLLGSGWLGLTGCSHQRPDNEARLIQREPWHTLAVAQQQLFPDDGNGPGARAIHATAYLKFVLDAPDTDHEVRRFILDGVDWLNRLAIARYTGVFAGCEPVEQHALLVAVSRNPTGQNWMSFLLTYLFEALLSDPVYGGNPGGVGWKWLDYIPGFPRPPYNKRYVDLI